MPYVYRITYPNGKIYVGKDETDSVHYFGSVNKQSFADDFPAHSTMSLTVTKDVLWYSESATRKEINQMEKRYILELRANDPEVGYNKWPRLALPKSKVE